MLIVGGLFAFSYHFSDQKTAPEKENALPVMADLAEDYADKPFLGTLPEGIKGFYLKSADIIQKPNAAETEISARLDAIIKTAQSYDFNTLLVDTSFKDQPLYLYDRYNSVLLLLREKTREKNLSLYLTYSLNQDEDGLTSLSALIENYQPDAVLLDGYYQTANAGQYLQYMTVGGGSGYENWLRNRTADQIIRAVREIRKTSEETPIGLLADPVWAYQSTAAGGIDAKSGFQAYSVGYADTKAIVLEQAVDFVCVKTETSLTDPNLKFKTAVDWWAALTKAANMPMLLVHAGENACTDKSGWNGVDQLARQVATVSKADTYAGSLFSGYDRMVSDPQKSTSALLKYYADEYKDDNLFQDLTLSQPKKTSVTTYEGSIVFQGKYDPQFEVTINGVVIKPNKEGEFQKKYDLEIGTNKFTIRHKGQVKTYTIVRKVKVFQSVSPTGKLEVDGETAIRVEAMAYRDSKVTAKLNGRTITLKQADEDENVSADSLYTMYVGTFTAPKAEKKNKNLGKITFQATYKNSSESRTGAAVTLLKQQDIPNWSDENSGGSEIPPLNPKSQIEVTSEYLEVYNPADTDPYPSAIYYGLPKGTVDYVDAQRKIGSKTFYYLHSGKRVLASEAKLITGEYHGNNQLSGWAVSEDELHTTLKVKTRWKAPFNITFNNLSFYTGSADNHYYIKDFKSDTVTITFDYATQAEAVSKSLLEGTTMFSDVRLEKTVEYGVARYKLHLKLSSAGRYYGCYSYYEGDTLVLRFNHLKPSLKGVRIFLDPGHGGSDPGALHYSSGGDYVDYKEADLNLAMTKKVAELLRAEGAVVEYLTEAQREEYTTRANKLQNRYKEAQKFKAEIMLSIHCNSSGPTATGTEAWYTAPFSMPLAREISAGISSATGLKNRGAKNNRFAVNRGRTFPSVLIETAFISNTNDLKVIGTDAGQDKVAKGIVNGIKNYLK